MRRMLRSLSLTLALAAMPCVALASEPHGSPHKAAEGVAPAEALARLRDGNLRFRTGEAVHGHQDPARRAEVAQGQHPFAIIVACADSRVGPEVLFDQEAWRSVRGARGR